jgi:ammonia channel protein AmtB
MWRSRRFSGPSVAPTIQQLWRQDLYRKPQLNSSCVILRGPEYIRMVLPVRLCRLPPPIVAGTVAERCKMQAYLCYSVFLTGRLICCPLSIWSANGFLTAFRPVPSVMSV